MSILSMAHAVLNKRQSVFATAIVCGSHLSALLPGISAQLSQPPFVHRFFFWEIKFSTRQR